MNPKPMTADELFAMSGEATRYELASGELRMMSAAGGRHGRVSHRIAVILDRHVEAYGLGVVLAAETGFLISTNPDTVLAPDVAFVSKERYEQIENEVGYLPLAPDLAIEVISPSERFSRVEGKAQEWLNRGCKLVLIVDPASETVQAMRSGQPSQIYTSQQTIDCSHAVPGWQLSVAEIYRRVGARS